MKKLISALFSVLLVFGMIGTASAIPTTWTDTLTPNVLVPPTYTLEHSIADSGFSSWWTGGDDTIDSFSLAITLSDDNLGTTQRVRNWIIFPIWFEWETVYMPDGTEDAKISYDLTTETYDFSQDGNTFEGTLGGIIDIWFDGSIDINVWSAGGDFYLNSSVLTVNGDDGTAPVPEPATMLLLGTGLVGLALGSRKKFFKK